MYLLSDIGLTPVDRWLDRLGSYLYHRAITKMIVRGESCGDFFVVPDGYGAAAVHRLPGTGTADPLADAETIGWKLVKR